MKEAGQNIKKNIESKGDCSMDNKKIQQAYVYGYPVMGMYKLLFDQVKTGKMPLGFNRFAHTASLSTPETNFVPAPNNDTTYSRAWLDLTKCPVIITVPDMLNRYYSIQMLDMYSETIKNVGKRTTGTGKIRFVVSGPDYKGEIPEDAVHIQSSTPYLLAFLRILINSEKDLASIETLQQQIKINYLTEEGNEQKAIDELPLYNNEDYKGFFETLSQVLTLFPKNSVDTDMFEYANKCKTLSNESLYAPCDAALKEIDEGGLSFGEEINRWRIARKNIGTYGKDYMQRAVVWYKGALANVPEESLYPSTFQDEDGAFLDGNYCYTLTFTKGQLPPVSQFWSLTLYRFKDGFLTDNLINRYSIGDRTEGLVYEAEGELTVYIGHEKPSSQKAMANWLPAPTEKFYLTLRLYGAGSAAINGEWNPPAVVKADE